MLACSALVVSVGATAGATAGVAAPKTRMVKIVDFEYKPARITVRKGTKIRWKNYDDANHTVTFTNGRAGLDNLHKDVSGTLKFKKPGRYKYVCDFHPNMHGTVVVR